MELVKQSRWGWCLWVCCWIQKIFSQTVRKRKTEVKWKKQGKNEICEVELEAMRRDCRTSQTAATLGCHYSVSDGGPAGEAHHHRVKHASHRNGSNYCYFWLTDESQQSALRFPLINALSYSAGEDSLLWTISGDISWSEWAGHTWWKRILSGKRCQLS